MQTRRFAAVPDAWGCYPRRRQPISGQASVYPSRESAGSAQPPHHNEMCGDGSAGLARSLLYTGSTIRPCPCDVRLIYGFHTDSPGRPSAPFVDQTMSKLVEDD